MAAVISPWCLARHAHCAIHSSIHMGAGTVGWNSLHRHVHGIRSVLISLREEPQAGDRDDPGWQNCCRGPILS